MNIAPRIAVPPTPPATRASFVRARRPLPRTPASARVRRRGLASALCGALAGLAAGVVLVAVAPVVGRTAGADGAASAPRAPGGSGRGTAPVSAVLAPAIDSGVVPAPDSEAARP
jgi:hypothetical protein